MLNLRLYRHPLSGHSHRVELFLSLLSLPFERVEVDVLKGAHKQPEFLAKNPFGQIPVLEDGELTLFDSNAILVYLALRYDSSGGWLPRDALPAAEVQRWFSAAAGPLVQGPNQLRLANVLGAPADRPRAEQLSAQLLSVMETTLKGRPYLVSERATVADVAMYTYTWLAPEGGISLEPYPSLRAWHARIEALPGFVPMSRASELMRK